MDTCLICECNPCDCNTLYTFAEDTKTEASEPTIPRDQVEYLLQNFQEYARRHVLIATPFDEHERGYFEGKRDAWEEAVRHVRGLLDLYRAQ